MKRALVVALALTISTLPAPAQASNTWVMTAENVTLGINGVSPHVERFNGVDRVWRSDGPNGTTISDCNDAGVCTSVSGSRIGPDFTLVTFPNGTKRAYFKDFEGGFQQVYSAPCTDAGCTSIGTKTPTSSEMRVPMNTKAWGVPDPVLLPDGRVRIYIVETPQMGRCNEKIATYISTDGITFTKEPGWRLEGGYVDTEVLKAKDGDWVMILADIACTASNRQELFVSTSKDGLTWTTPQILNGPGLGGLDPTGYEIAKDEYRIYFAQETRQGANDFTIKRGTLKLNASAATSVQSNKSKTKVTCVKGKKTKQFVGKCPKGYVKK